jgi:hypothetical protein
MADTPGLVPVLRVLTKFGRPGWATGNVLCRLDDAIGCRMFGHDVQPILGSDTYCWRCKSDG